MSGDVQPRKRKDKKKKKDDLGVEEPRGTAAALGEGDVFMHSYHDHGTGGHWCAKIIFFSLLAVLVTLIGLIILENRGLTELEANSVESRYSGVLEGWIEDAIDDHHDEHTLELKHHDDDEDHPDDQLDENELEEEIDHNDNDESNEDEIEDDETKNDDDEDQDELQNDEDELEDDDGGDDDENHNDVEEDHDEDNDEEDNGKYEEEIDRNDNDESNEDEIEDDETKNDDDEDQDELQNDEDELEDDDGGDDDENHNDDDEDEPGNDVEEDHDEDNDEEDNGKYEEEIEESLKDEADEETFEQYSYEETMKSKNYIVENGDENDNDEDEEEKKHDLSKEMTSHYNYHEMYENGDDESKEMKYNDENESNEEISEDESNEEDDQENVDENEEEIEKIEKEIYDDSEEIADNDASASIEKKIQGDASKEVAEEETSKEDDEPAVEKLSRPKGKPFVEIEEETPVKPVDTLAEEEAYEREQEELRRQEEQAPHSMWLKLCVGGALLAATHALVRRATRVDEPESEEIVIEETPSLSDRRMTIIDEPIRVTQTSPIQAPRQIIDEEVFKTSAPVAQSALIPKPKIEEEIAKEVVSKVLEVPKSDAKKEEEKELYSEEEEDEDEDVEEENVLPQKEPVKKQEAEESEPEPEPEEVSDVEIIYDETVEEEEIPEEEIEEEEISDVDDTELLSRLEAKYGRLPEPERPGQYKGGGNSLEADWPGEPSDPYWRSQLDTAEEEFRQGSWWSAARRARGSGLAASARARWLRAAALDRAADLTRDNRVLADAISAYLHLLKMNEAMSDEKLLEVARRTVDRIQFRGTYLSAEPVYRLLIRRFPDEVNYRNNLTVTYLMANRADLADEVLKETLRLWPNDRVALAHHGFVLKIHHNKLEHAVRALRKALDGDAGRANEPRFHYHLGDALLMLGRRDEAHEVHRRGAELGHFLSPSQRSLYNVPRLRGRPWWRVEDTPYVGLARALEASWRDILKEGESAVALYEQEKEGLRERGEWSQLDIFVRGREVGGRCARAPALCAALRGAGAGPGEGEGATCRRGQVKFSLMAPGTHVRPHVGPTNCRLRMHLALSNTEGTYLRVDEETRQWQVGKTLLFDDSFEHEVWHNGTGSRLVLIVDVWHPDLTAAERRQLPAI